MEIRVAGFLGVGGQQEEELKLTAKNVEKNTEIKTKTIGEGLKAQEFQRSVGKERRVRSTDSLCPETIQEFAEFNEKLQTEEKKEGKQNKYVHKKLSQSTTPSLENLFNPSSGKDEFENYGKSPIFGIGSFESNRLKSKGINSTFVRRTFSGSGSQLASTSWRKKSAKTFHRSHSAESAEIVKLWKRFSLTEGDSFPTFNQAEGIIPGEFDSELYFYCLRDRLEKTLLEENYLNRSFDELDEILKNSYRQDLEKSKDLHWKNLEQLIVYDLKDRIDRVRKKFYLVERLEVKQVKLLRALNRLVSILDLKQMNLNNLLKSKNINLSKMLELKEGVLDNLLKLESINMSSFMYIINNIKNQEFKQYVINVIIGSKNWVDLSSSLSVFIKAQPSVAKPSLSELEVRQSASGIEVQQFDIKKFVYLKTGELVCKLEKDNKKFQKILNKIKENYCRLVKLNLNQNELFNKNSLFEHVKSEVRKTVDSVSLEMPRPSWEKDNESLLVAVFPKLKNSFEEGEVLLNKIFARLSAVQSLFQSNKLNTSVCAYAYWDHIFSQTFDNLIAQRLNFNPTKFVEVISQISNRTIREIMIEVIGGQSSFDYLEKWEDKIIQELKKYSQKDGLAGVVQAEILTSLKEKVGKRSLLTNLDSMVYFSLENFLPQDMSWRLQYSTMDTLLNYLNVQIAEKFSSTGTLLLPIKTTFLKIKVVIEDYKKKHQSTTWLDALSDQVDCLIQLIDENQNQYLKIGVDQLLNAIKNIPDDKIKKFFYLIIDKKKIKKDLNNWIDQIFPSILTCLPLLIQKQLILKSYVIEWEETSKETETRKGLELSEIIRAYCPGELPGHIFSKFEIGNIHTLQSEMIPNQAENQHKSVEYLLTALEKYGWKYTSEDGHSLEERADKLLKGKPLSVSSFLLGAIANNSLLATCIDSKGMRYHASLHNENTYFTKQANGTDCTIRLSNNHYAEVERVCYDEIYIKPKHPSLTTQIKQELVESTMGYKACVVERHFNRNYDATKSEGQWRGEIRIKKMDFESVPFGTIRDIIEEYYTKVKHIDSISEQVLKDLSEKKAKLKK